MYVSNKLEVVYVSNKLEVEGSVYFDTGRWASMVGAMPVFKINEQCPRHPWGIHFHHYVKRRARCVL